MRELALGVEIAAHRCQRRVRANRDRADILRIEQVAEARRSVFHRREFGVEHQGLGAPHRRHEVAVAVDGRHLAGLARDEPWLIGANIELGGVPRLHNAILDEGLGALDRRLTEIHGAGLERQLGLGKDRLVVRLLVEIHLDAGLLGERVELLAEVVAGPAHVVDLARRGQRAAADHGGCCDRPGEHGAAFQEGAARDAATRQRTEILGHASLPRLVGRGLGGRVSLGPDCAGPRAPRQAPPAAGHPRCASPAVHADAVRIRF